MNAAPTIAVINALSRARRDKLGKRLRGDQSGRESPLETERRASRGDLVLKATDVGTYKSCRVEDCDRSGAKISVKGLDARDPVRRKHVFDAAPKDAGR